MKRLLVFGAGGHGKVAADAAEAAGWGEVLFYDDRWPGLKHLRHWPVVGAHKEFYGASTSADGVLVAVGGNRLRMSFISRLQASDAPLVSVFHPSAVVSPYASIGNGSVLFANAVVNADAALGQGVIINTGSSVDHECILGDGVHISPGARLAGQVSIGEGSWIGIGAVVREGVSIGSHCLIGAGAVVLSDIPDNTKALGIPARAVR